MKTIITGSTGMVGKGVLLECLDDDRVESVLLINRRPIGLTHPKIREVIHKDFSDFSGIRDQLTGYDACFHCMGVSAIGLSEEAYADLTYGITKALVDALGEGRSRMVFTYVSGTGTDSSEKGRVMWARVKGRTENMILSAGFRDAYAFRPGAIIPERGIKSATIWYNAFYVIARPLFPLLRRIPSVTTTSAVGRAMINVCFKASDIKHPEGKEINELAKG